MLLLIDNYDSFTYNVYQAIANLGRSLQVARNDRITLDEIAAGNYEALIISPGRARRTMPGSAKRPSGTLPENSPFLEFVSAIRSSAKPSGQK